MDGSGLEETAAVGRCDQIHALQVRNRYSFVDDIRFDSQLEARLYQVLKLRQSAGEVAFFLRQIAFPLEGGVKYRCDFFAVLSAGGIEVWDAKGMETQASANKRKQVFARYGIDVRIWKGE